METILKQYWGFDAFRPLQGEAARCVLDDRDSLVVMPTGGGKSLCYQAPALAKEGMAVVVSPLIALMKDQVDGLRACGVSAACINSAMTAEERREADAAIRGGSLKLLYVAPERLVTPRFIEYLQQSPVSFIAIDEAHCISHWGHDFRPEYRELRVLKEYFPDVAFHAYTATATEQVRADIVRQLTLRDPVVIVGSFDRPNLVYRAERRVNTIEQVKEIVRRHENEAGIVYCITRKAVNTLCAQLIEAGHMALPYHAGLTPPERKANQDAFLREDGAIMVATVAFGMGIDKPNVRYVVHAGMPKSIEHYQQESGRAGRDGLEAECCLLYSKQDLMTWRRILASGEGEGNDIAQRKLSEMEGYCAGTSCRHVALASYFGELLKGGNCGACDMCLGDGNLLPEAEAVAAKILTAVDELGDIAGPAYTTLVLSGSKDKRVLEKGHDQLASWGALVEYSARDIRDWIEQLVGQNVLIKTGEYNILRHGRDRQVEVAAPRLLRPSLARSSQGEGRAAQKSWAGVDKALFEHLRRLRAELARSREVPAYVIFGDATLRDMARKCPKNDTAFLEVSGVGDKKRRDFGEAFLEAIRDYLAEHAHQPEPDQDEVKPKRKTAPSNKTKELAWPLFDEGLPVSEIAKRIARTPSTVASYLEGYIVEKGISKGLPWVSDETIARVDEAVRLVGDGRLRPIHDYLNEEVPYEEIRLALACLRNAGLAQRHE